MFPDLDEPGESEKSSPLIGIGVAWPPRAQPAGSADLLEGTPERSASHGGGQIY